MQNTKNKRLLFQEPFKYKEGFLLSITLFFVGTLLGIVTHGKYIVFPAFPFNITIVVIFSFLLIFLYKFYKEKELIRWLSGIPAAITAIIFLTFVAGLMGIIPQNNGIPNNSGDFLQKTGLTNLTSSWIFMFAVFYFLTTLGFATVKMFFPFQKKRVGAILNHLGLYIILIAGIAGSSDVYRLFLVLNRNKKPTNIVFDNKNNSYLLPFTSELLQFNIKFYTPKIVAVSSLNGEIISEKNKVLFHADKGKIKIFEGKQITVKKSYNYAVPTDTLMSSFRELKKYGATAAVLIEIKDLKTNKIENEEWITCGNEYIPRLNAYINNKFFFALLEPEVKEYQSKIRISINNKTKDYIIKVNEPLKIDNWKLYQLSYDIKKGTFSEESVLEVVTDPWLPVVYFGIFLLMTGAIHIFWVGSKNNIENNSEISNI